MTSLSGDPGAVRAAVVGPGRLFTAVDWVASTGSTNADLAAAARAGAPSGTVLIADHQRAGRGRFARRWEAPPGAAVAVSVLLRPDDLPAERWPWLPLVTGVAVADGLRRSAGAQADVKWPNDVLIGEAKVCGILAERVGDAAVVGMGINTTLTEAQLPVPTATSLALAGSTAPVSEVVVGVLTALEDACRRWVSLAPLDDWYQRQCATVGRAVRVLQAGGGAIEGVATGVDERGRLRVRTPTGTQLFAAGDVVHLRGAGTT